MTIFQTTNTCIYALINNQDKKIFITYSRNFNAHLYTLMLKLSRNEHNIQALNSDREKLDVLILETGILDELYMRYRMYEIQEEWVSKGYTVYKLYEPLGWILTIKIEQGIDPMHKYAYRASIFVKTTVNKMYRLKWFNKIRDAENYINNNSMINVLKESDSSCR